MSSLCIIRAGCNRDAQIDEIERIEPQMNMTMLAVLQEASGLFLVQVCKSGHQKIDEHPCLCGHEARRHDGVKWNPVQCP